MSTVDYQTSLKLVRGEFKSDGYTVIIIYGNMFGGISFKLCKKNEAPIFMDQFQRNGWPHEMVWDETIDEATFEQAVKNFKLDNPNYHMGGF
jgi:hypothetical protein